MKRILFALLLILAPLRLHAQLVLGTTAECATSIDGTVVGTPNPLLKPVLSAVYLPTFGLAAGNYFVVIAWYDASANVTLVSPEAQFQLSAQGMLGVAPPAGKPLTAVGMKVFIGTSSGSETLQGQSTSTYSQNSPLVVGAAPPTVNSTICAVIANDAGWPTGTGYSMSLTDPSGRTAPGYPLQVQLLGPGNNVNVGNGLPLYNGTTTYPSPIIAKPYGHAPQSIAGPLNLGGYGLTAGSLNIGGPTTFTNSVSVQNPGVFTNAQMNLYEQSLVGGCDPATEFHAIQGSVPNQTEAGTFCLTVPSTATVSYATSLQAYMNTGSTSIPAAAFQAFARSTVPNVSVHASSMIAVDGGTGVPNNNYYGNEIFMIAHNVASNPVGELIDGDFFIQPGNSVAQLIAAPNSNHAGMYWSGGTRFYYGATKPADANNCALCFNPAADGVHTASQLQTLPNIPSQGMRFTANDSLGNPYDIYVGENTVGSLVFTTQRADSGVVVNGTFTLPTITKALSTTTIGAHTCSSVQSVTMTGVLSTSVIVWSFAVTPIGVVGYGDSTTPFLVVTTFPTTDTGNIVVCNTSASGITPGTMSLNLRAIN